ncbi:MAG: hypothetical protein ACPGXL_08700, partial [Chitinophagales bacterium]
KQQAQTYCAILLGLGLLMGFAYATPIKAQGSFELNKNCQSAYQHIMALRLDKGRALLQQERQNNPNNAMVHLMENYLDFFTVFILEENSLLQKLSPNKDKRLAALQKANTNSPYYRYAKAEINLQWAIARIKFEEYFTAAWEIRAAYKLLEENQRLYPNFKPNLKSLGMLHALIGTIPEDYKWAVSILGMKGTIKQGMGEVKSFVDVAQAQGTFYEESILLYTFLLVYLDSNYEKAFRVAQSISTTDNLFNSFIVAYISLKCGRGTYARQVIDKRPKGVEYMPFYFMDYFLGSMKLYNQEADAANYLKRYVNNFKGRHYLKDAYQKLAWSALLKGNREDYHTYMQKCKTRGKTFLDIDAQALKEAQSGNVPNEDLLQARLCFDGANYQKALNTLQQTSEITLVESQHRLEYNYRFGRVYEALGKQDQAVPYYKKTIEEAAGTSHYFAPKAAMQMGKIYEGRGDNKTARLYYQKCLAFSGYEYERSVKQQAKAGLIRIND